MESNRALLRLKTYEFSHLLPFPHCPRLLVRTRGHQERKTGKGRRICYCISLSYFSALCSKYFINHMKMEIDQDATPVQSFTSCFPVCFCHILYFAWLQIIVPSQHIIFVCLHKCLHRQTDSWQKTCFIHALIPSRDAHAKCAKMNK